MPKCPSCNKNKAQKHLVYGFVVCKACEKKSKSDHHGKNVMKVLEGLAIPFWRHMGLKPKAKELAMEKEMKRRGLSYFDLQKARAAEAAKKQTFDSTDLKNKLYRKELPHDQTFDYRKQRLVGNRD